MLSFFPYCTFDKVVPEPLCDGIKKLGDSLNFDKGGLHEDLETVYDDEIRDSSVSWLNNPELITLMSSFINRSNYEAKWNFDIVCHETPQYSTYSKNGFYDWHVDTGVESEDELLIRKLSLCISLNDDYSGGDFQVQRWGSPEDQKHFLNIKEMKNKGSIVVFPSFLFHRVTPVTRGTRNSLVCWFRGPRFR
jgi:PKHD-type hydroxylase